VRQQIRFEHFQNRRMVKIKAITHLIKKCNQPMKVEDRYMQNMMIEIKENLKQDLEKDDQA